MGSTVVPSLDGRCETLAEGSVAPPHRGPPHLTVRWPVIGVALSPCLFALALLTRRQAAGDVEGMMV